MGTGTDPDVFPSGFTLDMVEVRSIEAAVSVLKKHGEAFKQRSMFCRDMAVVGLASQLESRGLVSNARAALTDQVREWFVVH